MSLQYSSGRGGAGNIRRASKEDLTRTPSTPTSATYSSDDVSITRGREPPAIRPESVSRLLSVLLGICSHDTYKRPSIPGAAAPGTFARHLSLARPLPSHPMPSTHSPLPSSPIRQKQRQSTSAWSSPRARRPHEIPACVVLQLLASHVDTDARVCGRKPTAEAAQGMLQSRCRQKARASHAADPLHAPVRARAPFLSGHSICLGAAAQPTTTESWRRGSILAGEYAQRIHDLADTHAWVDTPAPQGDAVPQRVPPSHPHLSPLRIRIIWT